MPSFNFRRWIQGSTPAKKKPIRRGRYQLNLESFEDRIAPAGIFTWVGGGADSNWNTAANWSGGIVPAGVDGLDQLVFSQANAAPVNLPSSGLFQSITFGASGVNLAGASTFTITNGLTVNAGVSNTQIGIDLNLAGAQTFKVGSGSDLSTFGLTINGKLTGSNSLVINGPGTLRLTADNSTFSGALSLPKPVSIGAAIVQITNAKALGTGQVTISDGSELNARLSAGGSIANTLFVTGAGALGKGSLNALAGSAAVTWVGPITLTGPTDTTFYSNSSNSFIISGVVGDSGSPQNLIKQGPGVITLTNSNTYRGSTTIDDGALVVQNALALGTGTADVTVRSDSLNNRFGTLTLDGGVTVANRTLRLNGRGASAIGSLRSTNGDNTWRGNISLDGGAFPNTTTVDISTSVGSKLTISGAPGAPIGTPAITSMGAIFTNIKGGGTTVFATANTFTGTIQVNGNSTLEIRDSMALGSITGGNTQVTSGSTLKLAGGNTPNSPRIYADSITGQLNTMQISEPLDVSGSGVTVSGQTVGGLYSNTGINAIVGSLNLSGAIGVDRPGTSQNPNLPSGYPYNYDISGFGQMLDDGLTINGTFAASSFNKLGLGQLYLPNANTGVNTNTNISAGSITIGNSSSLGNVVATTSINSQLQTTVAAGATLNLLSLAPAIQNQQQTVTLANANLLNGNGVASNFRLIINGITTGNIAVGANGTMVASALAAATGLAASNFLVALTNPASGVYVYVVTFQGTLAGRQLPQLVGISAPGANALNAGAIIQAAITQAGSLGSINLGTQLNLSGSGITSPYQIADIPNYDFTNKSTAALMNLAGANTISGRLQLDATSAIGVEQAYSPFTNNVNYAASSFSQLTISGPISESAANSGLAKVGSQRLIIQGPGTYTGEVDIKQGTILLQSDTGLGTTPTSNVAASNGELIVNGNFEAGNTGFTSTNTFSAGFGPGLYALTTNPQLIGGTTSMTDRTSGTGLMYAADGSGSPGPMTAWRQTVAVTPNTNYTFSIWVAEFSGFGTPANFNFNFSGTTIGTMSAPTARGTWQQFTTTWNSGAATSVVIEVVDTNTSGFANDFALDDISLKPIAAVPPSVPTPIRVYELNGSYADAMGGPAIAPFGAGGTLTATNYQFPDNLGLTLVNSALPTPANYSIEMVFNISDISGYVNLIEFKNQTSDKGLYSFNGALTFYNAPGATGPAGTIANNTNVYLVLTRDSVTKTVVAYINGVQQFSFVDTANEADFASNPLHFFIDDTVVAGETSPGTVDRIRLFNTPLTATQVLALYNGGGAAPVAGNTTTTVWAGASLELGSTSPSVTGGIARGVQVGNETLVLNGTGNSLFGDSPLTVLSGAALTNIPPSVSSPIQTADYLWLSNINLNTFADRFDLPDSLSQNATLSATGNSGLGITTQSLILTPTGQPTNASFALTYGTSTVTVAWDPNPTQLNNNIQEALNQLIPTNTPTSKGASSAVFDLVFPAGNYLPLSVSAGTGGVAASLKNSLKFSGSLTSGATFNLSYGANTAQVTFSTNGTTLLNNLIAAFKTLVPANSPTPVLSGPNSNYGVFNIAAGTRLNLAGSIGDTANADVNGSDLAIVGTGIGASASSELNLSGANTYRGTAYFPQGLVAVAQNSRALGSAGNAQQQTLTVPTVGISTATTSGSTTFTATVTTASPHGFTTGQTVRVGGVSVAGYNGAFPIVVTSANTFTYTVPATLANATGGVATRISTFTLSFNGSTTLPIAYTANAAADAAEIAAQLNAAGMNSIAGVGGVVEVTPSGVPGVFVISLKGALSGFRQNLMTVSEPTAAIALTREGGGGTIVSNGASLQTKGNITISGEPLVVSGNGVANVTPAPNQWFAVGPTPIVGSLLTPNSQTSTGTVTSVAYDPLDTTGATYYVTASDGGAWKTLDSGKTWTPLFDLQTSGIFAGSIAVSPVNSNTLYLGTGESRNSTNNFYGSGVYRSTNAGLTWQLLTQNVTPNTTNAQTVIATSANPFAYAGTVITKVVPDPQNANVVYVAVSNGAYVGITQQQNPNAGIWRYDGGTNTWTSLTSTSNAAVGRGDSPTNIERIAAINQAIRIVVPAGLNAPTVSSLAVSAGGAVTLAGSGAQRGSVFSTTNNALVITFGGATNAASTFTMVTSLGTSAAITWDPSDAAATATSFRNAFQALWTTAGQGGGVSANPYVAVTVNALDPQLFVQGETFNINSTGTFYDAGGTGATVAAPINGTFLATGQTIAPSNVVLVEVTGSYATRWGQLPAGAAGYIQGIDQRVIFPTQGTTANPGVTYSDLAVITDPVPGNSTNRIIAFALGTPWGGSPANALANNNNTRYPNGVYVSVDNGTAFQEGGFPTTMFNSTFNTIHPAAGNIKVGLTVSGQNVLVTATLAYPTINMDPSAVNVGAQGSTPSAYYRTLQNSMFYNGFPYTNPTVSTGPVNRWNLREWTQPPALQLTGMQRSVLGNVPINAVTPPTIPPDGQFGQNYNAFLIDPSNSNRAFIAGVGSGATVGATTNVILQYNGTVWTDITTGGTGPGAGVTSLALQTINGPSGATTYLIAGSTRGIFRYNLTTQTWGTLNGNLSISQFNSIASNPTAVSPYIGSSTFGGFVDNDVAVYGGPTSQAWNYIGTAGSSPMPSLLSGTQVAYDPNNSSKMFKTSTSVSSTTTSTPGTTINLISEVAGGYNPPGPGANQFVGYYYEVRVASLAGISAGARVTLSGTTNFNETFVVHRVANGGLAGPRFYLVYLNPTTGAPVTGLGAELTGLVSVTSPAVPRTTTSLYSSPDGGTTWNSINPPGAATINGYWVNPVTGNLLVLTTNSINSQTVYSVGNPTAATPTRTNTNLLGGAGSLVAGAVYQGQYLFDGSFTQVGDIGANSPVPNTIYTLNANGDLTLTMNGGVNWVTRGVNGASGGIAGTASSLTVDPSNSYTVYVTTTGGEVWKTTDAGQNWENLAPTFAGLPTGPLTLTGTTPSATDAPVWALALDPRSGNLYVGTDQGVYYLTPAATSWQVYGAGLPSVQVRALDLNQQTNTLTIGTYGRGAFATSLPAAPAASGGLVAVSGSAIWSGPVILAGKTTIGALGTQTVQNGIASASLNLQGTIADLTYNPAYGDETAAEMFDTTNPAVAELTKTGFGVVILSGSNKYTGFTDVKQGVLTTNNANALGSPGAATIVRAGSSLQLLSSLATEPIYLFGNGIKIDGHYTGALRNLANDNTYSGAIRLMSNTTIGVDSGATLTIGDGLGNGSITDEGQGFSVVKELTGTLVYNGANSYGALGTPGSGTAGPGVTLDGKTYASGTVVSQGRLTVSNADALNNFPGLALNTTTVLDGAQLALRGGINVVQNLSLSGTGNANTGALYSISENNAVTGTVTLTQNAAFSPTSSAPTTVTIGVQPAANGATGTLTINGAIQQQIVGAFQPITITYLTQGLQNLTVSANSLTTSSGAATVTLDPVVNSAGTSSVYTLAFSDNITGGNFTLRDNNTNQTAVVNWLPTITLASRIQTALSNINNYTRVSSGLGLNKVGQGTLVLATPVNFSGETKVSTGILELEAGGNYGTITVNNGATLDLNDPTLAGINVTANVITNGTGFGGVGVIRNLQGSNTFGGTLTLQTDSTINVTNPASPLIISGAVQDFTPVATTLANLTKTGPGTLVLPSANTYGGITYVNQGTISAGNNNALGASAVAQVQRITVIGSTLGTFTMTYAGQQTAAISLNQLSSANLLTIIQRELNSLMQNVGVGGTMVASNINLSGSLLTFDVTLGGTYLGFNQPDLGGLGSASPSVMFASATTTRGRGGVAVQSGATLNADGSNLTISGKPLRLTGGELSSTAGSNTYGSGITLNGPISTISAGLGASLIVDKAIVQSVNGSALNVNGPGSVSFTQGSAAITGVAFSGWTATVTTGTPHGFIPGQRIELAYTANPTFNGTFTVVSAPTPNTFTYAFSTAVPAPSQGPSGAGFAFASNTYTGLTTVGGQGTLTLNKTGPALGITGNVLVGNGTLGTPDSTLRLQDDNDLNPTSAVTVRTDGNFDLNGYDQTVASLTINGGKVTIPNGSILTLNGNVSANSDAEGPARILGAGALSLGGTNRTFTVADGDAATDLAISSLIMALSSEGITKSGAGRLELDTVALIFSGNTTVLEGDVQVDAGTALSLVQLNGGSISGRGSVGNVTGSGVGAAVGTISPGYNGTVDPRGTLTINSNPTWGPDTVLSVDLERTGSGTENDQIVINTAGTVDLANALLTGRSGPGVQINDSFTILTVTGGGTIDSNSVFYRDINGVKTPIAQGGTVFIGGQKYTVQYNATTVVLTRQLAVLQTFTVATQPANPIYGVQVLIVAAVVPEAGAELPPDATVTFVLDGGPVQITVPVVNGTATFNPYAAPNNILFSAGTTHTIDATFTDASTNKVFADATAPRLTFTVAQNTVTLTPTLGLPSGITTAIYGVPKTLDVVVAAATTLLPTALLPGGLLYFTIDSDPTVYASPIGATVNGQATLQIPNNLSVGAHTINIYYNYDPSAAVQNPPDTNYAPISTPVTFAITITKDVAAISTTPQYPSWVSPALNPRLGDPISFDIQIAPGALASGSTGIPSGTVEIYDGTVINPANLKASGTLDGNGSATLNLMTSVANALSVGVHTLTVRYLGDGNYNGNTSTLTYTIGKGNTSTTVGSQVGTINYGQVFTVQANVAPANSASFGTPTGSVTFWLGAVGAGGTNLGTSSVNAGNGAAFLNVSNLSAGQQAIYAVYNGESRFEVSTGSSIFTISPAATSVNVSAVPTSTTFGNNVTFTAAVTAGSLIPNSVGAVTFVDTTTNTTLGTASVDSQGRATWTISTLSVGSRQIQANYTGVGNFASSSGTLNNFVVSKASSQVQVSATPSTGLQFGQSLTISATVSASNPGPSTGSPLNGATVTFYDGTVATGTAIGTGVVVNGVATLSNYFGLGFGTRTLSAAFPGDANFNASNGSLGNYIVGKAGTSINVQTSGTQVYGNTIAFQVTVTAPNGNAGTPTGSVVILDQSTNAIIGSGVLTNGVLSVQTSTLGVGTRSLLINFSGTGNYANSTATVSNFTIAQASTAVTSLTPSVSATAPGQPVTFTAAIGATNSPAAPTGGTVTFRNGVTVLGAVNLVNGQAQFTTSSLAGGSHSITATYNGSTNFAASAQSSALIYNVLKATTTNVSASPVSPLYGQSVTLNATVSGVGGPPTGNVRFYNGAAVPANLLGTSALAAGTASLTVPSLLNAGTYTIAAVYEGDADFVTSTNTYSLTVGKANTDLTIVPSGTQIYGNQISFVITAGATSSGSPGTPTGSVTLVNTTTNTTIGTAALSGGQVTFNTSSLGAGTFSFQATLTGSGNYANSTRTLTGFTITRAGTTVAAPTTSAPSVASGQPVTFTAQVTATDSPAAVNAGTVTFFANNVAFGTGTVNSSGVASLTTSSLAEGSYTITASYAVSANFNASAVSTGTSQIVLRATNISTIFTPANPTFGQSVSVQITVAPSTGSGTPTGTVQVFSGATMLGSGTLSGGSAAVTLGQLNAGTANLSVVYSGDTAFGSRTSATSVTVNQVSTSIALASSFVNSPWSRSQYGQTVNLQATVSALNGPAATSGVVTFFADGVQIGTVTLSGSNVATLPINSLSAGGWRRITASYSSSTAGNNYAASATVQQGWQYVDYATSSVAVSASPAGSSVYGQAVMISATVSSGAPGGAAPTVGWVQFYDGNTFLGWVQLSNSNVATYTTGARQLGAGVRNLWAQFGYSPNFYGSAFASTPYTVAKATPSVAISFPAGTSVLGQPATLVADVTVATGQAIQGNNTSWVYFYDNTTNANLGWAWVNASGRATLTTSALPLGNRTIRAVFGSYDSSINPASNTLAGYMVTATGTSTQVTSTPGTWAVGQQVTFTAQVTASNGATPVGTVTFTDAVTNAFVGTVNLANGQASISTTFTAGNHAIRADFTPTDPVAFPASTFTTPTQNVRNVSVVSLQASPTSGSASDTIALSISVSGSAGTPTGTVALYDGGSLIATLNLLNGLASYNTTFALGLHNLSAVYAGNSTYNSGTSNVASVNITSGPRV
ncbi:MAG: Ig-like domain repeat protein [Gemmataceae bacterium]|nr:Ig-like domain repeat protein [Gemmataceae bacterium]